MGRRKKQISQMFVIGLLMLCTVIFFSSCAQRNTTPQEHKKNRKTEEHKEKKEKRKAAFYNSKYIFVTNEEGKLEQRTRKGKLIRKLGFGKVCCVDEDWLYYVQQEKEEITLWKMSVRKKMDLEDREKLCSVDGKIASRICVEDPYIIFAVTNKEDTLFQYDMKKESVIPCKIKYPYAVENEGTKICAVELGNGCSYISVYYQGVFKQDLEKGETEAKCIYEGLYSCQNLCEYNGQLYFDHGNYTEPPLDAFSLKSFSEENGLLYEVSAGDIEEVLKKDFLSEGNKKISSLKYYSVFGDFWMDDGKIYVMADEVTYKEKGKKKSFLPVFSYDPLVGENSLTYERELTEFLEDEKGSGIVDVIGGSALVKREKSVYEFNLSTKKKKRLQKTDINYWYVFGNVT